MKSGTAKAGPARPVSTRLESIISYKLSVACIIVRLLADSILDNNQKTLIVCGTDNGLRW